MKKLLLVVVAVAVLSAGFSGVAYARDEGWYALGGLVGGLVIGSAMSSAPCYYERPVYVYQPAPAPVVVYRPYHRPHRLCYYPPVYTTTTTTVYQHPVRAW